MRRFSRSPKIATSQFPAVLRDPSVVAECLVRPVLAEHLFKSALDSTEVTRVVSLHTNSRNSDRASFSRYILPRIATALNREGTCIDAWSATSTVNAPSAREWHTAVWTGSEMIVWGG